MWSTKAPEDRKPSLNSSSDGSTDSGSRRGSLTEDHIIAAGLHGSPASIRKGKEPMPADAVSIDMSNSDRIELNEDSESVADSTGSGGRSTAGLLRPSPLRSVRVAKDEPKGFFSRIGNRVGSFVMEAMEGVDDLVSDKPKQTAAMKLAVVQEQARERALARVARSSGSAGPSSSRSEDSGERVKLSADTVAALRKRVAVMEAAKAAKEAHQAKAADELEKRVADLQLAETAVQPEDSV